MNVCYCLNKEIYLSKPANGEMLYQRTRRHYGNLNAVFKKISILEMRNVNKKSY